MRPSQQAEEGHQLPIGFSRLRFRVAMLTSVIFIAAFYCIGALSSPATVGRERSQIVMAPTELAFGTSSLSDWSRNTKAAFLDALDRRDASEWIIVQGNEAGDLDSLVSAMTWAFALTYLREGSAKAVALLQVEEDALDLRPENKLALDHAGMSPGHADILAIDDLPGDKYDLANITAQIRGFVLVDHNVILSQWGPAASAKVLGVMDHHIDRGLYPDASPRVIQATDSCSTVVANEMLKRLLSVGLPAELVDLILSTIALDSDDFKHGQDSLDYDVASRLFPLSSFHKEKLHKIMDRLDKELSQAKKDLDHLSVFDLLRRDWKGGLINSIGSNKEVHLGFASMPYSLREQIDKTPGKDISDWFSIESSWTLDIHADITVALTSFRDEMGEKRREIILVVKATHRLSHEEAVSLFQHIVKRVEASTELNVSQWKGSLGESGHKRYVWNNNNPKAGRKIVRPVVEDAVKEWLA